MGKFFTQLLKTLRKFSTGYLKSSGVVLNMGVAAPCPSPAEVIYYIYYIIKLFILYN